MKRRELSKSEFKLLLFDYIVRSKQKDGTIPPDLIAIKSITTCEMADDIARDHGIIIKYITPIDDITYLEEGDSRYIFSFEDRCLKELGLEEQVKKASHEMLVYYKERGMSLKEAMQILYDKFGYCKDSQFWLYYDSDKSVNYIMSVIQTSTPHTMGGYEVKGTVTYEVRQPHLVPYSKESKDIINVTELLLANQARIIMYPSLYESKIVIHLFARDSSKDMAQYKLNNLKKYIKLGLTYK